MRWWVMVAVVLAVVVARDSSSARPLVAQQAEPRDCMDNPLGPLPGLLGRSPTATSTR